VPNAICLLAQGHRGKEDHFPLNASTKHISVLDLVDQPGRVQSRYFEESSCYANAWSSTKIQTKIKLCDVIWQQSQGLLEGAGKMLA